MFKPNKYIGNRKIGRADHTSNYYGRISVVTLLHLKTFCGQCKSDLEGFNINHNIITLSTGSQEQPYIQFNQLILKGTNYTFICSWQNKVSEKKKRKKEKKVSSTMHWVKIKHSG